MTVWECGRRETLLTVGGRYETARGRGTERERERENRLHGGRATALRVLEGRQHTVFMSDKGFKLNRFPSESRKNPRSFMYPLNKSLEGAGQEQTTSGKCRNKSRDYEQNIIYCTYKYSFKSIA